MNAKRGGEHKETDAAHYVLRESRGPVPPFVSEMAEVWRAALARCGARAASDVTGLPAARAAQLVAGTATPTPTRSEAAALDSALGTDAASRLPLRSASVEQREPPRGEPGHPVAPKPSTSMERRRGIGRVAESVNPGLTPQRRKRAEAWEPRVVASGMTLAEIANTAGLRQGRTARLLRSGALPTPEEIARLERVLGPAAPLTEVPAA